MHDTPFEILVIATVIADLIVGLLGVALCGGLALVVHRIATAKLALLGPDDVEEHRGAVGIALAAVSFVFWPCALVLAFLFLSKPTTARTGRWCAFAGIGYLATSFVLGIVVGDALILSGLFPL